MTATEGFGPESARELQPTQAGAPAWAYGLLVMILLAAAALQRPFERMLPAPHDLTPGLTVSADPYLAPPNCPARRWSVGEYLPRSCLAGNSYRLFVSKLGLEPIENGHRERGWRHSRLWVRAGSDALGVVCAFRADCQVLTVVKNRFGAVEASADTSPTSAYLEEPLSFSVSLFLESLAWAIPMGVAGLAVLTQWGRL